jgi:hypothetical protein
MSKIKAPKFVWFIVGALVAVLLVPSGVALAKSTLKFTGIEGTSTNKADVSPAGQLLTNEADPSSYVAAFAGPTCASGGSYTVPSGDALIITGVNYYSHAATGEFDLFDGPVASPCGSLIDASISPSTVTTVNHVFQPGIAVRAGNAVGVQEEGGASGTIEIYGYLVPAGAVAGPLHSGPKFTPGKSPTEAP